MLPFHARSHARRAILPLLGAIFTLSPTYAADYYWTGAGTINSDNTLEWNDPNNWLIGGSSVELGGVVPEKGPSLSNENSYDNLFLTGAIGAMGGINTTSLFQRVNNLTIVSGTNSLIGRYTTNTPDLRIDGDFSILSGAFFLGGYSPNVTRFYGGFSAANGTTLGNNSSTSDGGYWDLTQATSIELNGVNMRQMTNNWQWNPQAWNFGEDGTTVAIHLTNNNVFELDQNVVASPRDGVNSRGAQQLVIYNQITGTGSLAKSGSATLILDSDNNNYTGATTINKGVLVAKGGNAIGDTSTVTLTQGAIDVNGGSILSTLSILNDETIGALNGTGGLVLLNGNTLTLGSNNTIASFAGVIGGVATGVVQGERTNQGATWSYATYAPVGTVLVQGAAEGAGNLVKTGSSSLTLTGTNLYTGSTTLQQGTLVVSGSILHDVAGALGKANSAIIWGTPTTPSSSNADTGNVAFIFNNTSNSPVNWVMERDLDGSTLAAVVGRPRFVFNASNANDTSTLSVTGNILMGGGGSTHYEFAVQRAGSTMDISGKISGGTGNLRWNGSNLGTGTFRLSNAANDYRQLNKLTRGNLIIVGSVGEFGTASAIGTNNLELISDGAPAPVNQPGGINTVAGVFLESTGARFERSIQLGSAATYTSGDVTRNGVPNGYKIGGLNTSGTVTYTGNISTQSMSNGLANLAILAQNGGTVAIEGLINDNAHATQVTRVTINQFVNHPDLVDAGANQAVGTATNGTVILSGANTYEGGTTVRGGTLLVNNTSGSATGTGDVRVLANATLGGTGSITGKSSASITLEAGSHLVVGATHGVGGTKQDLVLGNPTSINQVNLLLNGALHFDLMGAGSTAALSSAIYNDLATVNNDLLELVSNGVINLSNATVFLASQNTEGWLDGQSWKLIDWSESNPSQLLTSGLSLATQEIGDFRFTQSITADGFYITANLVPEPSKGLLVLAGLGGLVIRRNRRRP